MAELAVETFEVLELTSSGDITQTEETLRLISDLKLKGQQSLVNKDSKSIFPYRKITQQERNIYLTLCARSVKLEEYDDEVIPVRVLQVIAHAKDLFKELRIWCPENGDKCDPILVGTKVNPERTYIDETFLLARWGNELLSLEELIPKVTEKVKAKLQTKLAASKSKMENDQLCVDSAIKEFVLGDRSEIDVTYYGIVR